ncbi:MAG TPA: hypothetical protein EYO73_04230 [Sulfurimonas sp.]|nr:hypothetical protein [Sulfurimonas sp.]
MQLDYKLRDRIEAMVELMGKPADKILNEALDMYLKADREKQVERDLEEHKKETDLSYDEFWDDCDFDD